MSNLSLHTSLEKYPYWLLGSETWPQCAQWMLCFNTFIQTMYLYSKKSSLVNLLSNLSSMKNSRIDLESFPSNQELNTYSSLKSMFSEAINPFLMKNPFKNIYLCKKTYFQRLSIFSIPWMWISTVSNHLFLQWA